MQLTEKHQAYWSATLRKTAMLLVLWFVVTYVVGFYARELSFNFFWMAICFLHGSTGLIDRLRVDHLVLRPIDEPDGQRVRRG